VKSERTTVQKDEEREERITYEVVVDAYGEEERAMGWLTYLEDNLSFPFRGKCVREMDVSPLKKGETVMVRRMADSGSPHSSMQVIVEWNNRSMGVPLEQLLPVEKAGDTLEAVKDWHYWKARGYEF
jgi:hypothetical protein